MPYDPINLGTTGNDRTGDNWRAGGEKINAMTEELYDSRPDDVVIINQESDFPVQDATTITLADFTRYEIGAPISTAKTLIVGEGVFLTGLGQNIAALSYTGVGVMFTSANSWTMFDLNLSCTSGTVFASTGPSTAFVVLRHVNVSSCTNIGSFAGPGFFASVVSFVNVANQGATFSGASGGLLFDTGSAFSPNSAFIAFDLGTSTTSLFRILNVTIAGVSGAFAVSGLANSGNIAVGQRAVVDTANLAAGAITAFQNISHTDVRWFISATTGSQNSRNLGDALLTTLEVVTINTIGIFEEVDGGNWVSTTQSRFSTGIDGAMEYTGEVDIEVVVTGFATVEKVGGGSDEIELRFAKNWTAGDTGLAGSGGTTQDGNPNSVPLGATFPMTTGDDIRMLVANNTSTANINTYIANLIIREA